jgi:hypothetical protein
MCFIVIMFTHATWHDTFVYPSASSWILNIKTVCYCVNIITMKHIVSSSDVVYTTSKTWSIQTIVSCQVTCVNIITMKHIVSSSDVVYTTSKTWSIQTIVSCQVACVNIITMKHIVSSSDVVYTTSKTWYIQLYLHIYVYNTFI